LFGSSATIVKSSCLTAKAIFGPFIVGFSGGSFRVKAVIKNIGELEATNISWNINIISGYLFRGEKTSGKIDKILPGEEITIKSKLILGLGRTGITVNSRIQDGGLDIKHVDAFIFMFLIRIKNIFL